MEERRVQMTVRLEPVPETGGYRLLIHYDSDDKAQDHTRIHLALVREALEMVGLDPSLADGAGRGAIPGLEVVVQRLTETHGVRQLVKETK